MSQGNVKIWLTRGEYEKLENIVLEGRGMRLLGEHSPDLKTRVFLKGLPNYLTKISQVHEAVTKGSLQEVKKIISDEPKKKYAIAKDPSGIPLLHKAVYYDHPDIVEYLLQNHPNTTKQKDREGRTALHYCAGCKDPDTIWDILIEGGCDASICDKRGNPAAYYLNHPSEIEMPQSDRVVEKKANGKSETLDFKPSSIRIWIHNRDIGKLSQVLWEGHGSKLQRETSNNPKVRKFLEAVPFLMVSIKQIHNAVVKNDVDTFMKKVEEPVAPVILCAKDNNGLNVLHKAAGLGFFDIAKEIVERYPSTVTTSDNDGRTPLHYAAALKDGGAMYDLLVEYGADESKLDNKQKAPAFYKNRPGDIDISNLVVIPDAPRVSGTEYPKSWDWKILTTSVAAVKTFKKRRAPVSNSSDDIADNSNVDANDITDANDVTTTEDDSAFGSAESGALKTPQESTDTVFGESPETGAEAEGAEEQNDEDKDVEVPGDAEESAENGEEPEEEPEQNEEPEEEANEDNEEAVENGEEEAAIEENEGVENETENNDAEEPEAEPETEPEEDTEDPEKNEDNKAEEEDDDDEKKGPSTGDSGVDETRSNEDQVIVGEHEELPEADLSEGIMLEDAEVENLLVSGNMEQLAALVLNGEGRRLIGRQSGNPELQAFIDNVPSYVGKINAVHVAARGGNLRGLQNALDRRKFAIARDSVSPHGATPLHVAVVFGHTAIIRYLAGRFPETVHAVDIDGRTPLHYAATLADNGHYYNLLLHLGANPLLKDHFEHKAEYYKENQDDLSHKRLLRDFGEREELADEMLTDKVPGDDVYSSRRDLNEAETMAILERCFRLLASTRRSSVPNTPSANAGTMLSRCLKRPIFDQIKHRVTRMDHNLFDVIWPSLQKFHSKSRNSRTLDSAYSNRSLADADYDLDDIIAAPDYECYIVFAELLDPLIRNLHCVTTTGELPDQPMPCFFSDIDARDENENLQENVHAITAYDIDSPGKYISAATIDLCRNLANFSLPLTLTINQLEETEKRITGVLMSPEVAIIMAEGSSEDEAGNYYTLNEVLERPSNIRVRLEAAGLLIPINETEISDERRLHGRHWPYGRGVYVAAAGDVAVWVNVQDHIRIIGCTQESRSGLIGKIYVRVAKILAILDNRFAFKRHPKFGFLSARPTSVGNTMKISATAKLSGLSKKPDNLRHLCIVRGLKPAETMRTDCWRLTNQQCLSVTELQTLQDFIRAIVSILKLEKEVVLTNTINITTIIANIFRKKKSSKRRFKGKNVDLPIFREEEGRYLASSLGTPLIKGLTEVVHKRPKNPVTYLATYLNNFGETKEDEFPAEQRSDVFILPESRPDHHFDGSENGDVPENDDADAGYPESPESETPESAFNATNRDEHGQTIIHFSAIRTHPKDGLFNILQERQVNIGYRDELYRTARDVAEEANFQENVEDIDRYVVYLAARGETEKLVELLLEGYDHILDSEDGGVNIMDVAAERNRDSTVQFLQSIPKYVTQQEKLHRAIRRGDLEVAREITETNGGGGTLFAIGKNTLGRCSLHIAVLCEHVDIVKYISNSYPETLRIGDNLERTALHYAMGIPSVEILSEILIKAGAKRVHKDLKSRQPSYYFMNKSDIERLQDEEQTMAK